MLQHILLLFASIAIATIIRVEVGYCRLGINELQVFYIRTLKEYFNVCNTPTSTE